MLHVHVIQRHRQTPAHAARESSRSTLFRRRGPVCCLLTQRLRYTRAAREPSAKAKLVQRCKNPLCIAPVLCHHHHLRPCLRDPAHYSHGKLYSTAAFATSLSIHMAGPSDLFFRSSETQILHALTIACCLKHFNSYRKDHSWDCWVLQAAFAFYAPIATSCALGLFRLHRSR